LSETYLEDALAALADVRVGLTGGFDNIPIATWLRGSAPEPESANNNSAKTEIGGVGQQPQHRPGQVEQQSARAGTFGYRPPRDKDHQLASGKRQTSGLT
jgi:hypothetical protein